MDPVRTASAVASRFATDADLEHLPEMVVEALVTDFGGALARIWLHDPDTGLLRLHASAGLDTRPDDSGIDLTTYPNLAANTNGSREPVLFDEADLAQFEQPVLAETGVRACAQFPLVTAGEFQGALAHFTFEPLDDELLEVLTTFATTVGALIGQHNLLEAARQATWEKEESLALLDTLFAATPVALAFWDPEKRNVRINHAQAAMHEVPAAAYRGRTPAELFGPLGEDAELLFDHVRRTGEALTNLQVTGEVVEGDTRHWIVSYYPVHSPDGEMLGVGTSANDVTELKRIEEALRESEARFRLLVDGVTDYAVYLLDPDGRVVNWNVGAQRIMGYRADEIVGQVVGTLYPPEVAATGAPERRLEEAAAHGRAQMQGWRLRKDGSQFYADTVVTALHHDHGGLYGFSEVTRDITERRTYELQLRHQALHDPLTDLPNRALVADRLEQALRDAQRNERSCGLMVLDLDRFKEINDTLGHHAGDAALCEIGRRLRDVLRASDTVGRLGGDEFAVVAHELTESGHAGLLARKLLATIEQPLTLHGQRFELSASLGVAVFPAHATDADELMRRADAAMYRAKRQALGYVLFAAGLDDDHAAPTAADELRHAITRGELFLHYQPKLHLPTGRVSAMEALVRWHHPDRGVLAPSEFIPLAEKTGLIRPLTRWVLGAALRQCRDWRDQGRSYRVAVNLSARNLHEPDLVNMVTRAAANAGVPVDVLELEITEDELMWDPEAAADIIAQLGRTGVTFAIDDFGTGYSSLAYLKQLRVDELKIDKSFIVDLLTDSRDASIVRSIVELGHNLGMRVVAEGVETAEACALLEELGCAYGQGFHLRAPLPAREAARAPAA